MARRPKKHCCSRVRKALLVLLNVFSTGLTLFTGLRENPILVAFTGRYDGIRQRLVDGSINYEISSTELFRAHKLTPLEEIGQTYRFITAPRRDPSSIGEYRSVCTNLNSNSAPVMKLMYNDFWGKGPRRVQIFVYSISAPTCNVLNVKPAWRDKCVADAGSEQACYRYILDHFETLQKNRLIQVGVAQDFGERGVPFLRCVGRPNEPFEFQADLLAHQTYWAGAKYHVMIQTSECIAVPLLRNDDHEYGLFESQGVDEGADVLLALPSSGWFTWFVMQSYNFISLWLIVIGLLLALVHNRAVQYLPQSVRYSDDRKFLQYLVPFMPASIFFSDNIRLVITLRGSLLIASDVWMNHWLYIYLSILDALANIRMTYITLQVGTWMLKMKITLESFLFICAAIMKITWIMCLVQSIMRVLLKLAVRFLRSMRFITSATRVRLEWDIDGVSMFLSYKLYVVLLCLILAILMVVRGAPTFMERADPYKVGAYGGIPRITDFWHSEIACDLCTLLAALTVCGQLIGLALLRSKYKCIADNSVMRLLQNRYKITGWDGLLAASMLGLDPSDSETVVKGHGRAKLTLGSLLQLLYLSGPSAFVHLAGDYIFHHGGFTKPPLEFRYPAAKAVSIGLLDSSKRGSLFSRGGVLNTAPTKVTLVHPLVRQRGSVSASLQRSVFERRLRVVADGYLGKVLLVDDAEPGVLVTNKKSGLYEFVVTDALSRVELDEIPYLLTNEKRLRCD